MDPAFHETSDFIDIYCYTARRHNVPIYPAHCSPAEDNCRMPSRANSGQSLIQYLALTEPQTEAAENYKYRD